MLTSIYMVVCGLIVLLIGTLVTSYALYRDSKERPDCTYSNYFGALMLMMVTCCISLVGGYILPCVLIGLLMILPVHILSKLFAKFQNGLSLESIKAKLREKL